MNKKWFFKSTFYFLYFAENLNRTDLYFSIKKGSFIFSAIFFAFMVQSFMNDTDTNDEKILINFISKFFNNILNDNSS